MAAAANPFDLTGRSGPPAAAVAREWTSEAIAEKLQGYHAIAPEHWETIQHSTHVRYFLREPGEPGGSFRPGGFVSTNPYDLPNQNGPGVKRCIRFKSGFDAKAIVWSVAYEDIQSLYIKGTAHSHMIVSLIKEVVTGLNANINKVVEYTRKLEARLAALEARS